MKLIAKALIEAQKEMGNAKKDSINPFFKKTYADLNAIREACIPILNDKGVAVLQPMIVLEGKNYIKTLLLHDSGETIDSLTEIIYSKQNDAQAQGSGITYARRYGLQSLVNIGADDDDGNSASEKVKAAPAKVAQAPKVEAKESTKPKEKKQFKKGGFEQALRSSQKSILTVLDTYELTDEQEKQLTEQLKTAK